MQKVPCPSFFVADHRRQILTSKDTLEGLVESLRHPTFDIRMNTLGALANIANDTTAKEDLAEIGEAVQSIVTQLICQQGSLMLWSPCSVPPMPACTVTPAVLYFLSLYPTRTEYCWQMLAAFPCWLVW